MHEYADVVILYQNFDASIYNYKDFKPILINKGPIPYGRYLFLDKIAKDYDSVCVLDADMFFLADVRMFFEIASHGFPVGCNDEAAFDRKKVETKKGKVFLKDMITHRIICNVPFFFNYNMTKGIWSDFKKLFKKQGTISDYDLFNYALIKNPRISEKMVVYPSHSFTGVHNSYLKYETMFRLDLYREGMCEEKGDCVIKKDKFIVARDFMRVYSFHGKYFAPYFTTCYLKEMEVYFKNELGSGDDKIEFFLEVNEQIIKHLQEIYIDYVTNGYIPYTAATKVMSEIPEKHITLIKSYLK
jgi:hypothetical protein